MNRGVLGAMNGEGECDASVFSRGRAEDEAGSGQTEALGAVAKAEVARRTSPGAGRGDVKSGPVVGHCAMDVRVGIADFDANALGIGMPLRHPASPKCGRRVGLHAVGAGSCGVAFSIPAPTITVLPAIAVRAAVVSAVSPAHRAARRDVLDALAREDVRLLDACACCLVVAQSAVAAGGGQEVADLAGGGAAPSAAAAARKKSRKKQT